MKLGTLLLRNAAISLTQLEAALRAQVIYGGRLGTNLVELGFLDVDALSDYLGELTRLPVATRPVFDGAHPDAIAMLDAATAERLGVLPLAIGVAPDAHFAVAMIEPFDTDAIAELRQRTGLPVRPYVAPELRLLYYLEKIYGLPRKARFVRTGTRRAPQAASAHDDRRRSQPAGGLVLPPAVVLEPKRRRNRSEAATAPPPPAPPPPARLAWALAADRLERAVQRDQIGEVFTEFGAGRFDATIVFLVRDGNALGWFGRLAHGPPATPIAQLAIPLGPSSVLQDAHDGMRPFRGPLPAGLHPIEDVLWRALGTPPPAAVMVAPVLVKQRVVNLVYAHTAGALVETDADELAELAVRASDAYVRLIKKSRDGKS